MNDNYPSTRLLCMILPHKTWLTLTLLLCLAPMLWGQTVTDANGNTLFSVQAGVLYDNQSTPLLTAKGNLIFKGASESKGDIILLIGTENLFGEKSANVLGADMQTTRFALGKGGFYLPGFGLSEDYLIANYTLGKKGDLVLMAGYPAVAIAHLSGDNWTTGELTAVFYLLNEQLQLKEMRAASLNEVNMPTKRPTAGQEITIRRMWNTGNDDYSWDGQVLKRRWSSFDHEEWEFDGRILRRMWVEDGVEYEWDGKILKRRFNAGTEEFEWDGRVLRRRWNTGNDEFLVQGNVVKRMWDTGNDEWELSGDMPIPIIAMVVFGLMGK